MNSARGSCIRSPHRVAGRTSLGERGAKRDRAAARGYPSSAGPDTGIRIGADSQEHFHLRPARLGGIPRLTRGGDVHGGRLDGDDLPSAQRPALHQRSRDRLLYSRLRLGGRAFEVNGSRREAGLLVPRMEADWIDPPMPSVALVTHGAGGIFTRETLASTHDEIPARSAMPCRRAHAPFGELFFSTLGMRSLM